MAAAASKSAPEIDPNSLFSVLRDIASGLDSGNKVSSICKNIIGRDQTLGSIKSVAFDLVHLDTINELDWDYILKGLKANLHSSDPESQSVVLHLIPSIPIQCLKKMILDESLCDFLSSFIYDDNALVRSGALKALGYVLTQEDIIQYLALAQNMIESCLKWWQSVFKSCHDSDDSVSGSAFSSLSLLIKLNKEQFIDHKVPNPVQKLLLKIRENLFKLMTKNLSQLMYRANTLLPKDQIMVFGVIFALIEAYAKSMHYKDGQLSKVLDPPYDMFTWSIPAFGDFCISLMSSADLSIMYEASRTLLNLCCLCNKYPTCLSNLSISTAEWTKLAISNLINAWDNDDMIPARGDLIITITKHLFLLDITYMSTLVRDLIPIISQLSYTKDRTLSLTNLWHAVFLMDLKTRRLRQGRGDVFSGSSLQSILEDAFVSGVISGNTRNHENIFLSKKIAKASYPAFKQELVSTLINVVLIKINAFMVNKIFPSEFERDEDTSDSSVLLDTVRSDAQNSILDWLSAAGVSLNLTQACLGWENMLTDGYYGLTLPADYWLQLLQKSSYVIKVILMHYGYVFLSDLKHLDEEQAKTRKGKVLKALATESFEIQKLLKRMVFFWNFLNDMLKPRIFWVVCHHLEFPDVKEDVWKHLKECLIDLLILRETEARKWKIRERARATSQGTIASSNPSPYSFKAPSSTSLDNKHNPLAIDHSEVALEGTTVGVMCLEVLVDNLLEQYDYDDLNNIYHGIRDIAELLEDVCKQMLDGDFLTVDTFDQCQAVSKKLKSIEEKIPEGYEESDDDDDDESDGNSDANRNDKNEDNKQKQGEHGYLKVNLEKKSFEGYPFSGSKALFQSHNNKRYRTLSENLNEAINEIIKLHKDIEQEELKYYSNKYNNQPPVSLRPSPVELAGAVGGLNLKGILTSEEEATYLTGQGDPVILSIKHKIEQNSRMLKIDLTVENKIGTDVTGLIVSIAIDGPIGIDREGMIVWHPDKLPVSEPISYQIQLELLDFGEIEILPFMEIALQSNENTMSSLTCASYIVPVVDLLVFPRQLQSPASFFREIETWPASVNTTGVCRWPGTHGGLTLLSVLDRPPLKCIWPSEFTSATIFQAIYVTSTFNNEKLALHITGQLLNLKYMGLAAWSFTDEKEDSSHSIGYYLCRITFTSTSHKVITTLKPLLSEVLLALTDGGMVLGMDPGAGRPPPPAPLKPQVVPLDWNVINLKDKVWDLQNAALEQWKKLNNKI